MRVFLSSTFGDLAEHRTAVTEAVAALRIPHVDDIQVVRAEDFSPADRPVIDAVLEQVRSSDLFVLVLGWRYGYVPADGRDSLIELEYETAKRANLVILPFIVKDDYPVPPRQIETGENAERLRRLKDRVAREQVVRSFGSPDELAKEVALAITRWWTIPMGEAVKDIVASPEIRRQLEVLKSERTHHLELIADLRANLSQVVPARPIWRARNFEQDSTLCFCLLPFQDEFIRVFEEGMLPAAQAAGLRGVHAGQIFDNREIVEDIWELICTARVVVADVTGRNPNVFYELGVCHTLGKEVVVMTQNADDVPFDIRHRRFIQYEPEKLTSLRMRLQQTIQRVLTRTSGDLSPNKAMEPAAPSES